MDNKGTIVVYRSISLLSAVTCIELLFLVSCSGSDDPSDPEQDGLKDGAFDEIEGMELAADQLPITPEDELLIMHAEDRLIRSCMADKGFEYNSVRKEYAVAGAPLYLSPDELRRSGYQYDWKGHEKEFIALNVENNVPDLTEGLTPEETEAYMEAIRGDPDDRIELESPDGGSIGSPASGCLGDAHRELYGSIENYMRFDRANETISRQQISKKLRAEEIYTQPLKEWRTCMHAVEYADTSSAASEEAFEHVDYGLGYIGPTYMTALSSGEDPPTLDEIQDVADADADCQESSGLFEVRQKLLPDAMDEVAAELGFEMSEYIAIQHAVLERAKQVL